MSYDFSEIVNYIVILKEWLEGNSDNINSLERFGVLASMNDITHIKSMINDCLGIIEGTSTVHISDISFYAIACRNSKERKEESYKHSLFIINFIKSPESLFYIVD